MPEGEYLARLDERLFAIQDRIDVVIKRQDTLEGSLDRRLEAIQQALQKQVEAATQQLSAAMEPVKLRLRMVEFIAYGFAGSVLLAFIGGVIALVFNVGGESHRVMKLPTTPYYERNDR